MHPLVILSAAKNLRMDIDCTDRNGSRFIVEMQLARQSGFYERVVFYSALSAAARLLIASS